MDTKRITITNTTLILSGTTILLTLVNNFYLQMKIINIMAYDQTYTLKWVSDYTLLIAIPFGIITSILPIFWAWQNYKELKKGWFYAVAVLSIILGLPYVVGLSVLTIYVMQLWQEFQDEKHKAA